MANYNDQIASQRQNVVIATAQAQAQIAAQAQSARAQINAQRPPNVVLGQQKGMVVSSGNAPKEAALASVNNWEATQLGGVSDVNTENNQQLDEAQRQVNLQTSEQAQADAEAVNEQSGSYVTLNDGELVPVNDYNNLTGDEKQSLQTLGVAAFNVQQAATQKAFEAANTQVTIQGKLTWVANSDWNKLTPEQQAEVESTGQYTTTTSTPAVTPPVQQAALDILTAGGFISKNTDGSYNIGITNKTGAIADVATIQRAFPTLTSTQITSLTSDHDSIIKNQQIMLNMQGSGLVTTSTVPSTTSIGMNTVTTINVVDAINAGFSKDDIVAVVGIDGYAQGLSQYNSQQALIQAGVIKVDGNNITINWSKALPTANPTHYTADLINIGVKQSDIDSAKITLASQGLTTGLMIPKASGSVTKTTITPIASTTPVTAADTAITANQYPATSALALAACIKVGKLPSDAIIDTYNSTTGVITWHEPNPSLDVLTTGGFVTKNADGSYQINLVNASGSIADITTIQRAFPNLTASELSDLTSKHDTAVSSEATDLTAQVAQNAAITNVQSQLNTPAYMVTQKDGSVGYNLTAYLLAHPNDQDTLDLIFKQTDIDSAIKGANVVTSTVDNLDNAIKNHTLSLTDQEALRDAISANDIANAKTATSIWQTTKAEQTWVTLTDAQKQSVAQSYFSDAYKGNIFSESIHGLDIAASKNLVSTVAFMIPGSILNPIAKVTTHQPVSTLEWATGGLTVGATALAIVAPEVVAPEVGTLIKAGQLAIGGTLEGVGVYEQTKNWSTETTPEKIVFTGLLGAGAVGLGVGGVNIVKGMSGEVLVPTSQEANLNTTITTIDSNMDSAPGYARAIANVQDATQTAGIIIKNIPAATASFITQTVPEAAQTALLAGNEALVQAQVAFSDAIANIKILPTTIADTSVNVLMDGAAKIDDAIATAQDAIANSKSFITEDLPKATVDAYNNAQVALSDAIGKAQDLSSSIKAYVTQTVPVTVLQAVDDTKTALSNAASNVGKAVTDAQYYLKSNTISTDANTILVNATAKADDAILAAQQYADSIKTYITDDLAADTKMALVNTQIALQEAIDNAKSGIADAKGYLTQTMPQQASIALAQVQSDINDAVESVQTSIKNLPDDIKTASSEKALRTSIIDDIRTGVKTGDQPLVDSASDKIINFANDIDDPDKANALLNAANYLKSTPVETIARYAGYPIKFTTTTDEEGNETTKNELVLWKGLKSGNKPIVGMSGGELVFGKSINIPDNLAEDITKGYIYPKTGLETAIMADADNMKAMGFADDDILKVQSTLKALQQVYGKASPDQPTDVEAEGIKSLSAEGVKAVLETYKENINDMQRLYGSGTMKPQFGVDQQEYWAAAGREINDMDVQTKMNAEDTAAFAQKILARLQVTEGIDNVSISEDKPNLISTKQADGTWMHAVDIHSIDEPVEGQTLTEGEYRYGFKVEQPAVTVDYGGNIGQVKWMSLSESAIRKGTADIEWHPTDTYIDDLVKQGKTQEEINDIIGDKSTLITYAAHRAKDAIDFYTSLWELTDKATADKWAEDYGYDADQLADLAKSDTTPKDYVWEIKFGSDLPSNPDGSPSIYIDLPSDSSIAVGGINRYIVSNPATYAKLSGTEDVSNSIPASIATSSNTIISPNASISSISVNAMGQSPSTNISSSSTSTSIPIVDFASSQSIVSPNASKGLNFSGSISSIPVSKIVSTEINSISATSINVSPSSEINSTGISPSIVSPSTYISEISPPPSASIPSPSTPSPSIPSPSSPSTSTPTSTSPGSSGIPLILGSGKQASKGDVIPDGTYVWQQGELHGKIIYRLLLPPWKQENLTWSYTKPDNTIPVQQGRGSSYRSIEVVGGVVPGESDVTLGIENIQITMSNNGKPIIKFARNDKANQRKQYSLAIKNYQQGNVKQEPTLYSMPSMPITKKDSEYNGLMGMFKETQDKPIAQAVSRRQQQINERQGHRERVRGDRGNDYRGITRVGIGVA